MITEITLFIMMLNMLAMMLSFWKVITNKQQIIIGIVLVILYVALMPLFFLKNLP